MIIFRLELSFIAKDHILTNHNMYKNSNDKKVLITAIETLEQAQIEQKKKVNQPLKEENFWTKVGNIFNPFKCGKDQ